MRGKTLLKRLLALTFAGALLTSLANMGLLDLHRLGRGAVNIGIFLSDLFPPDWSVLPTATKAMVETVQIAFVGTMLGFMLALPFALVASRTLFGTLLSSGVKFFLAIVRTVPSLLWAIIFVVAVGLGPGAGTLGIALYSLGYMSKIFYETFEGVDPEVLEAVRSVGCNRLQLARFALLPEAANVVLAQLLFMFEYNVRASSILGFVGAGGIGFYLLGYIQALQYDRLMTALLVTLTVVILIDRLSAFLRRYVLLPAPVGASR